MQIIENAISLFTRYGYDSISIDRINEECGIARGTFYLYFKNKEDLLGQILSETLSEMLSEIKKKLDDQASMPNIDEEFSSIVEIVFAFFTDKLSLLRIIILSREFNKPNIDSARVRFSGYFVERYKSGLLSKGLTEAEAESYVAFKFVSLHSVAAYALSKYPENESGNLKITKLILT
jgi:AcrR family transcriptional regulator